MTRISATRRVSAILAAVALGLCAPPAGAKPIDTGPAGSFIVATPAPRLASSPSAASRTSGSATSDWELVAAGSGAAALGLGAVGATLLATRRRRRRRTAVPPNVAANGNVPFNKATGLDDSERVTVACLAGDTADGVDIEHPSHDASTRMGRRSNRELEDARNRAHAR